MVSLCLRSLRTPQERAQNLVGAEQTAAFPVPQISEERVPDRSPELIMNFPVFQNMEAYAGRVRDIPLERVQHHSFVRQKRVFVDFLPLHKASKPYTGKVFTVNLRHHRDDQASSDCVGFISGFDKHNMPRLGDVMVPPPRSTRFPGLIGNLRLLRTNLCTASIKGTRAAAAVPSSNVELWAFSSMGRGGRVWSVRVAEAAARCGWTVSSVMDVPAPLQVEFQQSSLYAWMVPQIQFIDRVLQPPVLWWRILTVHTVHYR